MKSPKLALAVSAFVVDDHVQGMSFVAFSMETAGAVLCMAALIGGRATNAVTRAG
jgi:hypothetical protein